MEKEEPKKVFCKSIRAYFREYCNCTGVHGFRYFGEKRTIFERVWWFIIFTITLGTCIYLIREVYQKWDRSPVIVSFATRETPIYSIPFPSVTICPETKANKHRYNHTDILKKCYMNRTLTDEEEKLSKYMNLICKNSGFKCNYNKLENTISDDFYYSLYNLSSSFMFLCKFMGKRFNCDEMFKPIITDEGICYTFNMLDRSEIYKDTVLQYADFMKAPKMTYKNWTMEDGYHSSAGVDTYPRRAEFAGAKYPLIVNFGQNKLNYDFLCNSEFQGYRVILHTAVRIPRPSLQYFHVPFDKIVIGQIQPVMITTSDSVKVFNPRRRECYFPSERNLRYFKIYTQKNCKLECFTNYTLHTCGCAAFYMPRDSNSTRICGIGKERCIDYAERKITLGDLYNRIERDNSTFNDVPDCNCMPLCADLTYDVDITQNELYSNEYAKTVNEFGMHYTSDKYSTSRLVLFFKNTQFVTSKRHELYGPTDFLANFGGLLGLFTGFSVLSLMEIIYFLTVRLCCNIRLYGKWSGPED